MSASSATPVTRRWPEQVMPWARWLMAIAVFVWLGARHWPETVDDTVISINYARQWAEGHGLTWTTGERVEGYSNFLLVALLPGSGWAPTRRCWRSGSRWLLSSRRSGC